MRSRVRRKFGDRRLRPRFDIVGDLWGTLETVLALPLKNVSRGGVMLESHLPLPAGSVHRITFRSQGEDISTSVCVRHVRPESADGGEPRFLIGAEFIAAPPTLLNQIDQWLVSGYGDMSAVEV